MFNLQEAIEESGIDRTEVVYSLNMEDVLYVVENYFSPEDQERIMANLTADVVQNKMEIDWCAELEALISAHFLY